MQTHNTAVLALAEVAANMSKKQLSDSRTPASNNKTASPL